MKMEQPEQHRKLTDEQYCIALAFAIRALHPALTEYRSENYGLSYNDDKETETVTMRLTERKHGVVSTITLSRKDGHETFQISTCHPPGYQGSSFQKTKSALRKVMMAIPLNDFAHFYKDVLEVKT